MMDFSTYWPLLPFVGLLLSIAIAPLFFCHAWERHRTQILIVLLWSLPTLFYYGVHIHPLLHSLHEYASFICLIGSLFIISGGVSLEGDLQAKPKTNLAFLGIGAILASLIGTTGASMLLIRPFLKTNSERKHTWHLPVFFIFIVSNFGGLLTPLGDPPLFLGFLQGVPFEWTFKLFKEWAIAIGILLVLFFIWDSRAYQKETLQDIQRDDRQIQPLKMRGGLNFILLSGVIGAIFFPSPYREILMIVLSILSYKLTRKEIHRFNQFSFGPIAEVAILFAGIFITMTPVLSILQLKAPSLGIQTPSQFFWATGVLSSFLDNAPTYLTFFNIAKGLSVSTDILIAGVPEHLLEAISVGAVFMGANSYIGNGPNFMVKAIAEQQGFKTLNFGAYMLVAAIVLGPIYLLFTYLYFLVPK